VATDAQIDQAASMMHKAADDLFREMLSLAKLKDADVQAALLNGLLAAAAYRLWEGREPHATPEIIADAIRESTLDILRQCKVRDVAHVN